MTSQTVKSESENQPNPHSAYVELMDTYHNGGMALYDYAKQGLRMICQAVDKTSGTSTLSRFETLIVSEQVEATYWGTKKHGKFMSSRFSVNQAAVLPYFEIEEVVGKGYFHAPLWERACGVTNRQVDRPFLNRMKRYAQYLDLLPQNTRVAMYLEMMGYAATERIAEIIEPSLKTLGRKGSITIPAVNQEKWLDEKVLQTNAGDGIVFCAAYAERATIQALELLENEYGIDAEKVYGIMRVIKFTPNLQSGQTAFKNASNTINDVVVNLLAERKVDEAYRRLYDFVLKNHTVYTEVSKDFFGINDQNVEQLLAEAKAKSDEATVLRRMQSMSTGSSIITFPDQLAVEAYQQVLNLATDFFYERRMDGNKSSLNLKPGMKYIVVAERVSQGKDMIGVRKRLYMLSDKGLQTSEPITVGKERTTEWISVISPHAKLIYKQGNRIGTLFSALRLVDLYRMYNNNAVRFLGDDFAEPKTLDELKELLD